DFAARLPASTELGSRGAVEQVSCALIEPQSGLRELNRFCPAAQQANLQIPLELLDLMSQRRRRDVQPLRRTGEVLLIAQRHEISVKPQFDTSHSFASASFDGIE